MVHSEKFVWPTPGLVKSLGQTQIVKLCGLEIGVTSNLFEIRLVFTNNIRSPLLRAETFCSDDNLEDSKQTFNLDPAKRIADVYINQNEKTGMICGIRIMDDKGETMVDELWNKFSAINKFLKD